MSHEPKNKIGKNKSCGNVVAVESLENQPQVFHAFHRPLEIAPRFPHSHSSDDESYFSFNPNPDGRGASPLAYGANSSSCR
jgi:hypothetical protein